jgi:hypothetical protein
MAADAYQQAAAVFERMAAARDLSWSGRKQVFEQSCAHMAESGNPIAATLMPNVAAAEGSLREVLARVRLLRMAIDLRRGIESQPLTDPLGDGLLHAAEEDGAIRLFSPGATTEREVERRVAR